MPSSSTPRTRVTGADLVALVAVSVVVTLIAAFGVSASTQIGADPVVAPPEDGASEVPPAEESGEYFLGYPRGQLTAGQEHQLDVARDLFSELGHRLTERQLSTAGYNVGVQRQLNDGVLDVAITADTFSSDVCRGFSGVETSAPVARLFDALLLPEGNPHGLSGLEDVVDQDIVLGVDVSGPHRERAEAAGVPEENLVESEFGFLGVKGGEIDAFLGDSQELTWQVRDRQSELDVTEPLIPVLDGTEVEEYTGFYVSNPELTGLVDEVLDAMRADGRLLESGEEWGMAEDHLPPESVPRYDACVL